MPFSRQNSFLFSSSIWALLSVAVSSASPPGVARMSRKKATHGATREGFSKK